MTKTSAGGGDETLPLQPQVLTEVIETTSNKSRKRGRKRVLRGHLTVATPAGDFNGSAWGGTLPAMWIRTTPVEEASGLLRRLYDEAIARAGKVYAIVQSMSLNPRVLRSSIALYRDIMMGTSPLTRTQRELLATAVSRLNECHY